VFTEARGIMLSLRAH